MSDFIAETREMLDAIAGEIVAWEANPRDNARLAAIFRFVHSVKGSCGFLDLPRLARLSHAAEDVLADLRAKRRPPDAALVSAVLRVVDRIGELAQAIGSGESLPAAEDDRLIAALAPGAVVLPVERSLPPAPVRTLRLPIELLDRIMAGAADLAQARDALALALAGGDDVATALARLTASVDEMRQAVTHTRLQRVDQLFAGVPRMVRDLSAELGRSVALELAGGEIVLDRELIEAVRDPLTHIVRNAIDHGIEPAAARAAAGKPATGTLRLAARWTAHGVCIEVSDDGRGIDGDRLAARAVAAGLVTVGQAGALALQQRLALMFEPGISTALAVTAISGRGVGMDVVRANIERIGGTIAVDSLPGEGTRISLLVPATPPAGATDRELRTNRTSVTAGTKR